MCCMYLNVCVQENQVINHRPAIEAACVVSQGQTGAIKGSPGTGASVVLTPRSLQAQAGLSPQLSLSSLMPAAGEKKKEERKE